MADDQVTAVDRIVEVMDKHRLVPMHTTDGYSHSVCAGCRGKTYMKQGHEKHLAELIVALPDMAIVTWEPDESPYRHGGNAVIAFSDAKNEALDIIMDRTGEGQR